MKHGYEHNLTPRFRLTSEDFPHLLLLVVCISDATLSQDPETIAVLRNFQTPLFVDDTSHWSKVLQLFISSESEMQMLQEKTHDSTSKMRNHSSFQLYAPEDEKTGNLSTPLEPADTCAGLAQNCVLTWDKDAFPLCCFSGVFDSSDGEVPRETSGFGGHVVFWTRVDFGAGLFLRGRKLW